MSDQINVESGLADDVRFFWALARHPSSLYYVIQTQSSYSKPTTSLLALTHYNTVQNM